jgi:predicted lipoprotein
MKTVARAAILAIGCLIWSGGCASDDDDDDADAIVFDDAEILNDYAYGVVIPTYARLADAAADLRTAAGALIADASDANLDAAKSAWTAARRPWEQSEAWLFGPVASLGLDPALDTWPVNKTDLDAILASGDDLTAEVVAGFDPALKGFHAIEYLLFGVDAAKTAGELTDRELEFLAALVEDMTANAETLSAEWSGEGGYAEVFASAGQGNAAYPTLEAAAQEIVEGMIGICDEVGNGKMAGPYAAHDPDLVESQFSKNSIADFTDNLLGVRNAFTGEVPDLGLAGRGIEEFVAAVDADLAARVLGELDAAVDALAAIPPPFSDAIVDPSASEAIEAARSAINAVLATLINDVVPLVGP